MTEIVYVTLDPALEAACLSQPLAGAGLRITNAAGQTFQGASQHWWLVAWRAQQAGIAVAAVEAIHWP